MKGGMTHAKLDQPTLPTILANRSGVHLVVCSSDGVVGEEADGREAQQPVPCLHGRDGPEVAVAARRGHRLDTHGGRRRRVSRGGERERGAEEGQSEPWAVVARRRHRLGMGRRSGGRRRGSQLSLDVCARLATVTRGGSGNERPVDFESSLTFGSSSLD